LAEAGLRSTLERYVHDYEEHFGIKVDLCFPDLSRRLTAEQEIAIFRIVQEALQNVKKHAEASQVCVDFARGPSSALVVTIRDDGKGFEQREHEVDRPHSLGLVGMLERAELIQGRLSVVSRPGHGTQVILTVPNILPGPQGNSLTKEVELRTELGF
ncbi:MAG: ATP-binding protein, partial [Chloroflexi bacterium]|nr:ATP-binding protein [Chloroflexota bacterium]